MTRAGAWTLVLLLLSCGARSGIEVVTSDPVDAGRLDASAAADTSGPRDAFLGVDASAPTCGDRGSWVVWDSPTTEDLGDVIVNEDGAWITGAHGTLLRWDGASWRHEDVPTSEDLGSIWVDRGAGWIITTSALLRLDAGRWRTQSRPALPGIATFSTVWGRAADDVWFGGGSVSPALGMHAHWDGTNVTLVAESPTRVQVEVMRGSEDRRAIWSVSQFGRTARTRDGGPWELIPEPIGETQTNVWAPTADDAWFSAYSEVHHWVDGHWERFVVTAARVFYYTVWGSSRRDIWVAGYEGVAAHFDGAGWSEVTLPTRATLTAIAGRCATDAWMVGSQGTILRLVPAR